MPDNTVPDSTPSDSVAIGRGIYDALAVGDAKTAIAVFDESIEWCLAEYSPLARPDGKPLTGVQEVVTNVFARPPQLIDGFRIDVQHLIGSAGTVVAETRYAGTGKATGKPLDVQAAHVWDLRDGKVVRFQQYVDTLGYRQAVVVAAE